MEGDLSNCHTHPSFFSSETGVYSSKHPPRALPQDPLQDLVSFLFSHEHLGTTALVDSSSGSSISYQELKSMVASTASGLRNAGVSANEVVLLLLPTTILYPVLFLGVLHAGAVATTMNPLSSTEEIMKSVGACNPVVAFTSPDRVENINGLGIRAIAVPDALDFDSTEFSPFASVLSGGDGGELPRPEIRQTDTACILYSSGTSGLMKGVVLSHANMIAAAELFVRFEALQYTAETWKNVYLAALPMFHVYGLVLFAVGLLSLGSTVVVMRRFNAEEAARAIERFEVTHFPLVPPVLGALVRARSATGCEMRSLKQVSSGAAPLSNKVVQDFLQAFPRVDFIQGYGMTESTAVGTRGFNTEKLKKHNSVGLLAPNMQAKVVDCYTGACLPPGKSGELWLRGPGIMKGYLNDEKATSSTIDKNGWLRTADIAYFDEDGYLYVLDRLKDIIKYKGYQIAPADLEAVLISHPEIIDAGVTSGEDEEDGEIPVAFVVRKPGSEFSADEVMKYVSKKVAPYKKVRRVVFVQSIPKSPTGKIMRRLLRGNHAISRM
ncbi:4-coumarate--CoA ligase-like 6 [Iris pallida]|uniref:4-coumarate--CoA ligase n=1 Tax=Iris pallida TaxID=29817 RepID=A0AAX6F7U0_IRIPA|nr:4-coumarate--CoA ligase-like 6 [Iris pallida]